MNTEKHSIWYYLGAGGGDTEKDRSNNKRLTIWSLIWAASIIAATWVMTNFDLAAPLQWLLVAIPNLFAIVVIRAYLRFLRMTDELQRKVQIEGLAVGFGAGYTFAIGYLVAEAAGAPSLDIPVLILIMTAGWLLGNVFAMRQYQ